MVILTYIIFFLPASKEEVEEWELLEDAEISAEQSTKRKWEESCTGWSVSEKFFFPGPAQGLAMRVNNRTALYLKKP